VLQRPSVQKLPRQLRAKQVKIEVLERGFASDNRLMNVRQPLEGFLLKRSRADLCLEI